MGGRKIQIVAHSWSRIPWNRNCNECIHFAAAPANQQGQQALLSAVWNHFNNDHYTELTVDPNPDKRRDDTIYRSV